MAPVTRSKYIKSSKEVKSDAITALQSKLKNKTNLIDRRLIKLKPNLT